MNKFKHISTSTSEAIASKDFKLTTVDIVSNPLDTSAWITTSNVDVADGYAIFDIQSGGGIADSYITSNAISANGDSEFNGEVTFNSVVSVNGDMTVYGNMTVHGELNYEGLTALNGCSAPLHQIIGELQHAIEPQDAAIGNIPLLRYRTGTHGNYVDTLNLGNEFTIDDYGVEDGWRLNLGVGLIRARDCGRYDKDVIEVDQAYVNLIVDQHPQTMAMKNELMMLRHDLDQLKTAMLKQGII